MEVFETIYEDLTHLGGPMGSEYTTEHSLGLFSTEADAKTCARNNYEKVHNGTEKWEWVEVLKQQGVKKSTKEVIGWRSPDLRFVMYHVKKRTIN